MISCESYIGREHETTLGWYLEHSEELLIGAKAVSIVET